LNDPSQDIARWIEETTRRAVSEQIYNLQRYNELIQRISRGELDQEAVRQEYLHFIHEESQRYLQQLAQASLSYYNQLVEISRTHNDLFFTQVLNATQAGSHNGDSARLPARKVEMNLRAVLNEEANGSFILENKRAEEADISFMVSEFSDESGAHIFRPPLQIVPPRFRMGPFEEVEVRLRLLVLPELFESGKTYITTILVRGYDDLELLLTVQVEPGVQKSELMVLRPGHMQSKPLPAIQPDEQTADDLTMLAGLGQVYAGKLYECGIYTFTQLASTNLDDYQDRLGSDGLRRARVYRWQEQARQAARGEFSRLSDFRNPTNGAHDMQAEMSHG